MIKLGHEPHSSRFAFKTRANLVNRCSFWYSAGRVFGSVARGTDDEQSDVDFLVELAPDRSLLDLGGFLYEMRSLLGTNVDMVTEKGLRKRIREKVLAKAVDV